MFCAVSQIYGHMFLINGIRNLQRKPIKGTTSLVDQAVPELLIRTGKILF